MDILLDLIGRLLGIDRDEDFADDGIRRTSDQSEHSNHDERGERGMSLEKAHLGGLLGSCGEEGPQSLPRVIGEGLEILGPGFSHGTPPR